MGAPSPASLYWSGSLPQPAKVITTKRFTRALAISEALSHGTPHLAAIHQVLDRRRFASGQPPPIPVALPDDPRIKNLVVKPHALGTYDALTATTEERTDADAPEMESRNEDQDPEAA